MRQADSITARFSSTCLCRDAPVNNALYLVIRGERDARVFAPFAGSTALPKSTKAGRVAEGFKATVLKFSTARSYLSHLVLMSPILWG
jgi:hypothetical protein